MKIKTILVLITLLLNITHSFGQKKFKELFEEAKTLLDNDDYENALPILLELSLSISNSMGSAFS